MYPKRLLSILIISVVVLFATCFSSYSMICQDSLLATTSVDSSINKSISYFKNHEDVDISTMFNYHFLARKFDISDLFPTELIYEKLNSGGNMMIYDNALLYRLIDKSFTVSKEDLEKQLTSTTREVQLRSVYCDLYPIDKNKMLKALYAEADKGDYALTHALLSLQWMKENNCFKHDEVTQLEKYIVEKQMELLNDHQAMDDLTIEAIAFLLYCNYHNLIKANWLDKVIVLQQDDGGWKWNSSELNTATHPSILALWALLEWREPGRNIPWIEKL